MVSEVFGSSNYGRRRQYWHYEGQEEGVVFAGGQFSRGIYMRVEIKYGNGNIDYKIIDSRNLKQNNSSNVIHKNAFSYLSKLEQEVRMNLGRIDRYKRDHNIQNP